MDKVTAGIIQKDGKILIAKRKTGTCIGKKWEFPGGKLEDGEALEQCLKRELMEELNFEVEVGEYFASSAFLCEGREIELVAFMVDYISGDIVLTDHEEVQWIEVSDLSNYEFTTPDIPIVKKLLEHKNAQGNH